MYNRYYKITTMECYPILCRPSKSVEGNFPLFCYRAFGFLLIHPRNIWDRKLVVDDTFEQEVTLLGQSSSHRDRIHHSLDLILILNKLQNIERGWTDGFYFWHLVVYCTNPGVISRESIFKVRYDGLMLRG